MTSHATELTRRYADFLRVENRSPRTVQSYVAAIIDYQLDHGHDGLELAGLLAKTWIGVPVCIVSAAADEKLPAMVSEHGHDFLRKPVKPGKLRALLERYMLKHGK